ncbi:MAG: hypothetical protein QM527_07045 [Alphaproteobacteria bacterium]|nr:hypothetical protein [Alphaproteobacteria bacterium]
MAQKNPTDPRPDQPLGLTVHTMPSPGEVMDADLKRTRAGRWSMLAVLLVCAAPVVASYFTYYVIRPQNQKSYGQLIQPTRIIPEIQAVDLNHQPVALHSLKKQWLLISVSSGACDEACIERLYLQRQVLTALGRERERFDWVWLINDEAEVPAEIRPGLSEAMVLRVKAEELKAWLEPQAGQALSDHWYLVDPMGEWMMRFPAPINKESVPRIKRDIERLLRASAGWDLPGR